MTSISPASITTFPRGHEFAVATFTVTAQQSAAYCAAIGDSGDYARAVPPLAAVALGLRALQQQIALPEGSLHTGQEVEHERAMAIGSPLELRSRIAQRSERQGYVISVIELDVAQEGETCVRARATIMAPAGRS
jgi:hypothetical protein